MNLDFVSSITSKNNRLNYSSALQSLYKSIRSKKLELSIPLIERVQGQVVDKLMDNPSHCGAIGQDAVLIRNPKAPDETVFIPPDAKDVVHLMSRLSH